MMFKYKTQSRGYYCRKLSERVNTRSRVLLLQSPLDDKAVIRVRISFDCDHKLTCGICDQSCKLISFNWKECVNPLCVHSQTTDEELPEPQA